MLNRILVSVAILSVAVFSSAMVSQTVFAASNGSGDVVTQTVPGKTVAEKFSARAKTSWPWYVARASGMVAAITLIVLILSGIGQVTGYTFRLLDPLTSWASHRAIGIACGVSILIHIFSLFFDKFVGFSLLQLFVPWLSNYKPAVVFGVHVGSLWVALGVLAFYLTWIVIITSLLWVEKKPYIWKLIHLISYVIILFVFIHGLYIGTDLSHGIWKIMWWIFGLSIVVATLHRLLRAKTT